MEQQLKNHRKYTQYTPNEEDSDFLAQYAYKSSSGKRLKQSGYVKYIMELLKHLSKTISHDNHFLLCLQQVLT